MHRALKEISEWCRRNRHQRIAEQNKLFVKKLRRQLEYCWIIEAGKPYVDSVMKWRGYGGSGLTVGLNVAGLHGTGLIIC